MEFSFDHNNVDQNQPLIYKWILTDGSATRSYIGKAEGGSKRPLSHYRRNVNNLLSGKPYRKSNPNGYRVIHRAMADCVRSGGTMTLCLLENVDVNVIYDRERELIALHRCDLNG